MRDPMQVRVCGPLELYARGFGAELLRLGYTRISAGFQLYLMAHLSRWLVEESSGLAELTPSVVERFLSARRATGYTNYRTSKALEPLLKYLRNLGAVPLPPVTEPTALETVLERYAHLPSGRAGAGQFDHPLLHRLDSPVREGTNESVRH